MVHGHVVRVGELRDDGRAVAEQQAQPKGFERAPSVLAGAVEVGEHGELREEAAVAVGTPGLRRRDKVLGEPVAAVEDVPAPSGAVLHLAQEEEAGVRVPRKAPPRPLAERQAGVPAGRHEAHRDAPVRDARREPRVPKVVDTAGDVGAQRFDVRVRVVPELEPVARSRGGAAKEVPRGGRAGLRRERLGVVDDQVGAVCAEPRERVAVVRRGVDVRADQDGHVGGTEVRIVLPLRPVDDVDADPAPRQPLVQRDDKRL
eukprot:2592996-Prymnesium_polylepis.1